MISLVYLFECPSLNFPIPGNDDARRAINLYCDLIKHTILDAEQYASKTETDKIKKDKKEEKKEIEDNKKIKAESSKKNEKAKTPKKLAKALISKVKSLTSKKSK